MILISRLFKQISFEFSPCTLYNHGEKIVLILELNTLLIYFKKVLLYLYFI